MHESSSFWGAVGGPGFTPVCTRRAGRKSRIRGAHAGGPSGHPAPRLAVLPRRRPIRRTFLAVTRSGGRHPLNARTLASRRLLPDVAVELAVERLPIEAEHLRRPRP